MADERIDAKLWLEAADLDLEGADFEGEEISLEVERTDRNEVAFHTFIRGEGSKVSIYVNRDDAIEVARQLLNATRVEWSGPGG
jgi:hypothetical protein